MSDTGDSGAIGSGPNLSGRGRGRGRSSPFANINAKVSVDGLKDMSTVLKEIAESTKQIRRNFEAINTAGRSGSSVWSKMLGRGGPGGGGPTNSMPWTSSLPVIQQRGPTSQVPAAGGAPPAAGTPQQAAPGGGTGGSTLPWMSRLGAAAVTGANILSGRIGRNLAESTPILAQSALLSSMYSGMDYSRIESQRYNNLGRYGGTRQEAAETQRIALRFGQTPQQAGQFMQGVGNVTQAMGGTMTTPQVAQATGGFLEPMVLRRQAASGMRYAREGGQVRNPADIAQDYIKNYEQRRNGGVKLNEFDFINLQTPGSGLRITFSRLYGLNDESIDMIATIGMQTARAGGQLNYNSSAAIAQGTGNDRSRLPLAAAALGTTKGVREASFAQQNEGGMVTQLRMEQTLQEALTGVEDAASGLTNTFAALDKVIKAATVGFGLLVGTGAMGGMGGGGGLLGRLAQGLGGAGAVGAPGAVGNAGVVPAANVGGRMGAMGMGIAGRGMIGATGAVMATGGLMASSQSRNWGDVFSSMGSATAGGAMLGGSIAGIPGAIVGGGLAAGGSLILGLFGMQAGENEEQRQNAATAASNLTDKEILDKLRATDEFGVTTELTWNEEPNLNLEQEGMYGRFMNRRSALVFKFMEEARNSDPVAFDSLMRYIAKSEDKEFGEVLEDWAKVSGGFQQIMGQNKPPPGEYINWAKQFEYISKYIRSNNHKGKYTGYESMHDMYLNYFETTDNPMRLKPIYSDAAIDIIDEYSWTATDMAAPVMPDASGDPEDTGNNENANTMNYSYIDRMPMAKPPDDRTWGGLDARMKKRLLALFAASKGAVTLGGGGGTRTEAEQKNMFLDRYRVDPNGEVEWQGKRWHRVKGAAAAPPGRSMHEIGLAADLAGPGVNNGWLKKNAARFGLKEFSNVNDEPWHVQPAELPNSRREYEGGDFGSWGSTDDTTSTGESTEQASGISAAMGGASGIGGSSLGTLGLGTSSLSTLQGGAAGGGGAAPGANLRGTGGATSGDRSADVNYSGEGPLTGKQVAQLAYNAGFRGENLIMAVAISKRESGWDPGAFNGNSNTGDKSYGLFQINMIGDLGPSRREQYGLSKNEDLFDPKINMKAAYMLSSSGTNFHHWGGYKGMEDNYNTDMSGARSIVQSMGLGDAVFDTGMVGTGGITLPSGGVGRNIAARAQSGGGGMPINVNVTINSTGNYAYDAKQLARHIRPAMEQEYAEVSAKRNM